MHKQFPDLRAIQNFSLWLNRLIGTAKSDNPDLVWMSKSIIGLLNQYTPSELQTGLQPNIEKLIQASEDQLANGQIIVIDSLDQARLINQLLAKLNTKHAYVQVFYLFSSDTSSVTQITQQFVNFNTYFVGSVNDLPRAASTVQQVNTHNLYIIELELFKPRYFDKKSIELEHISKNLLPTTAEVRDIKVMLPGIKLHFGLATPDLTIVSSGAVSLIAHHVAIEMRPVLSVEVLEVQQLNPLPTTQLSALLRQRNASLLLHREPRFATAFEDKLNIGHFNAAQITQISEVGTQQLKQCIENEFMTYAK